MRVYIQWSTQTVADWVAYDITGMRDIRSLPKKPSPSDSPIIDNQLGWVCAVNIQGVVFEGYDHIGFDAAGSEIIVTCWNDDPVDFPAGSRWGQVWRLDFPAPDVAVGGLINTRQTVTWYCEAGSYPVSIGLTSYRPYSEMVFPNSNNTIHGVWLPDTKYDEHVSARTLHGWREWIV